MSVTFATRSDFGPKARELSKITGLPALDVLKDEMRIAITKIQNSFTPPMKGGQKNKEGGKVDKKGNQKYTPNKYASTKTLSYDLRQIADMGNHEKTTIPNLQKAIMEGRVDIVNAILQRLPAHHTWANRTVISPAQAASQHRRMQNARGRINREQKNLVIEIDAWQRRRNRLMSGIGIAKASWVPALLALGGKPGPQYVTRHGTQWGEVVAMGTREANQFGAAHASRVAMAGQGIKRPMAQYKESVDVAIRGQARSIATKINRLLNGKAITLAGQKGFMLPVR